MVVFFLPRRLQVMTPENWNSVLSDATQYVGWGGGLYIVLIFVLGNLLVLALFIAVLLGNFGDDDDDKKDEEKEENKEGGDKKEGEEKVRTVKLRYCDCCCESISTSCFE